MSKILFLDIETAPNLAYVWGAWKQNIGYNQVVESTSMLSWAAKWLGNPTVAYADVFNQSEEDAIRTLYSLLDEAEVVVTHNGKSFDIPVINTRAMLLGFRPASPFRQVDTFLEAKKRFRFTMNSLAYLAEFLDCTPKDQHKEFPGFELWKECMNGNPAAWKELVKYNVQDVITLEEVYLRMRPWMSTHPNVNLYEDTSRPRCPKCGGEVVKRGYAYTLVNTYQRYRCKECGGWCRSRFTETNKDHRKNILAGVENA